MARNLRLSADISLPLEATKGIEWVAGLFEGEGCIHHLPGKRGNMRRLSIGSTDLDVLQALQQAVGAGQIRLDKQHGGRKPYWRWTSNRWRDVQRIGKALLPYLCGRRRAKMLTLLGDPPVRNVGRCWQGHPLEGTDADVYKYIGRSPACAICARERSQRWRDMRKSR